VTVSISTKSQHFLNTQFGLGFYNIKGIKDGTENMFNKYTHLELLIV
jgi:hypothetical protein